jgi:proteic killer suppression protein
LHNAVDLKDLKSPPANKLHALIGDRAGQHAIAVNDQFRIVFVWTDAGPERVEFCDYH